MASKKRFYIALKAQFRENAFEKEFEKSMQCLVREIKKKYLERKDSGVDVNYSSTIGKENGKGQCVLYNPETMAPIRDDGPFDSF